MWSRKFYHIFDELSTEVIRGNCEDKREYATFREVEPIECSSSQTRRPTNWATPGNMIVVFENMPRNSQATRLHPDTDGIIHDTFGKSNQNLSGMGKNWRKAGWAGPFYRRGIRIGKITAVRRPATTSDKLAVAPARSLS